MHRERLFIYKIMKYSREYILRRAFDVFMSKGYDSTSISVLQEELQMSRGAMYRYFKNKEELFRSVIDEYFFKLYNKLLQTTNREYTVLEFIEVIYRRQLIILNAFNRAGFTHTVFLNYTALIIQAAKHYPNFVSHFKEINGRLLANWKKSIYKSIEANEIRSDIDVDIMSILFNSASVRESSEEDCLDEHYISKNMSKEVERKKEVMLYLYSLIKV